MKKQKKHPTDHIRTVAIAQINLVPGVGGAIASLVDDYIPSSRQRAMEEAVERMKESITAIETRVDVDAVDKEDFAELFNKFETIARNTNRQEKLNSS